MTGLSSAWTQQPNIANTKLNNTKSFIANNFDKDNQPKSDSDCTLGVHTASNQHTDRNYEFYWGYKNHILLDCITGLPIFETTTGANTADSSVAVNILKEAHTFMSKKSTILSEISIMVTLSFLSTPVIPKILNSSLLAILSVKPDLPCTVMVLLMTIIAQDNSFAVLSNALNPAFVPAIISNGIMAGKTEAVKNILLFLMITGFPLTVLPKTSKIFINFVQSANVTILVLKPLVRHGVRMKEKYTKIIGKIE